MTQFDKAYEKMTPEERSQARRNLSLELARLIRSKYATGREALAAARKMVDNSFRARKAETN